MDLIKKKDAPQFKNSPSCVATEYDFKDEKDFNIAGISLNGRYPEKGYALNLISKELIYVRSGSGSVYVNSQASALAPGDAALIQPNEKYYLEGNLELIISSSPAWHPEQHKNVLD